MSSRDKPSADTQPAEDINQQKNLRQQAEAALSAKSMKSWEDLNALVPERLLEEAFHELHVHQIELELQNEELRLKQQELVAAKARYFDLYDLAPVGYLTVNEKGLITQANLAVASLLGLSRRELVNKRLSAFIVTDDQDSYYRFRCQVFESNEPQSLDLRMLSKDGTRCWVRLEAVMALATDDLPTLRITLCNINKLIQTEVALHESNAFKQDILNSIASHVAVLDCNGVIVAVNESWRHFTVENNNEPGIPTRHAQVGSNYLEICRTAIEESSDDRQETYRGIVRVMEGQLPSFAFEYACHSSDQQYWFMVSATPLGSKKSGVVISHTDITERKIVENTLSIAAIAFESQEGIMITDCNGVIIRVNNAFTHITGYRALEAIGKNPRILKSGHQNADFYAAMWADINNSGVWSGELWNRRKNGDCYPQRLTITAVKNTKDIVSNYVGTFTDITMIKQATDEIKHLAFYDPLTDLPNRRLFQDRLKTALALSHRSNRHGAVLLIDMDNFKILNDTLGHDIGDLLIQQVAQRLELCVREGDSVARLGGDEFVVMLEDLSEQLVEAAAQTEVIGNKILCTLSLPYQLDRHDFHCTSSIGAVLFDDHEQSVDELLKQADIAMYQAKAAGRNALRFFDQQMQITIDTRMTMETNLHLALKENQFRLYYQSQVDHNDRIIGAEVLIRWQHPQHGFIFPADFIPLAEASGLILPIGQWVLETACAQLNIWAGMAHTRHLQLAVNVSARQFRQADFVAQVRQILGRNAINPEKLKLELTESLVLDNIDDTILKMHALRECGIRFAMDDFGTGYSSLSSLKKLPFDQLKIDQSFVRDLASDPDDAIIVQTIIAMARSLGMEVIAEGVETEAQRSFLKQYDCPFFQGYLFSKPVPIEQFELLLK